MINSETAENNNSFDSVQQSSVIENAYVVHATIESSMDADSEQNNINSEQTNEHWFGAAEKW